MRLIQINFNQRTDAKPRISGLALILTDQNFELLASDFNELRLSKYKHQWPHSARAFGRAATGPWKRAECTQFPKAMLELSS